MEQADGEHAIKFKKEKDFLIETEWLAESHKDTWKVHDSTKLHATATNIPEDPERVRVRSADHPQRDEWQDLGAEGRLAGDFLHDRLDRGQEAEE